MSEDAATRAVALALCAPARAPRARPPAREGGPRAAESISAQAERLFYYTLVGAIEAGLVGTAEDALTVLRQASAPLGPMGGDWLAQRERRLDQA